MSAKIDAAFHHQSSASIAKLQSAELHGSHSATASNRTWSGYKRSLRAAELDFNVATTHKSNQELRQSDSVKNFFARASGAKSLKEVETRKWIGSLPSTMTERAIPLFTDDNGTDFQLHFSYTWMGALHTARTKSAKIVDPYVHCLLNVVNRNEVDLIARPNIVIPLGKLCVNKSNHSTWTGYEILVSSDLDLWIIYTLDEVDPEELHPDEVRRSRWDVPGSRRGGQTQPEEPPDIKIARLWDSLPTIESATFRKAEHEVQMSLNRYYVGSMYLLELSRSAASQAIQLASDVRDKVLATGKFEVHAESSIGDELFLLANEHAKTPLIELKFSGEVMELNDIGMYRDLLSVAVEYADETILTLLLAKGKVNVDPVDREGRRALSYATANAAAHAAEIATRHAAASMPRIDYSEHRDIREFLDASPRFRFFRARYDEADYDEVAAKREQEDTVQSAVMRAAEVAATYAADHAAQHATRPLTTSATVSAAASAAAFVAADAIIQCVSRGGTEDATRYEYGVVHAAQCAVGYTVQYVGDIVAASASDDVVDEYLNDERHLAGEAATEAVVQVVADFIKSFGSSSVDEDFDGEFEEEFTDFVAPYVGEYAASYTAQYVAGYAGDRILKLLQEYRQKHKRPTGDTQEESSLSGQRSGG